MRIYPEKSLAAIEPLARKLGLDAVQTAKGIYEIANTHMGSAVRVVTIQRGVDPREYAVMAFGGAGPVHAVKVAEQFEIPNVIVPLSPGLTSALRPAGFGHGRRLRGDALDGQPRGGHRPNPATAGATGAKRVRRACAIRELNESNIVIQRQIDVRFKHQSHELSVPIPAGADRCGYRDRGRRRIPQALLSSFTGCSPMTRASSLISGCAQSGSSRNPN